MSNSENTAGKYIFSYFIPGQPAEQGDTVARITVLENQEPLEMAKKHVEASAIHSFGIFIQADLWMIKNLEKLQF